MALSSNTRNCKPPQFRNKGEANTHYVICTLCMLAGVEKITSKNSQEVFGRLHAIEEIQGAMLMGPDGDDVFLTQADIDRWIGMTLNVLPMNEKDFNATLEAMRQDKVRRLSRPTPGSWKAQQDCRSYRNNGIFNGQNPDPQGNQNAWAIYGNGSRIAVLEEAESWRSQNEVNANARLMAAAPDLLEAVKVLLAALENASQVVDKSEGEDYAYQGEIEAARKLLDAVNL